MFTINYSIIALILIFTSSNTVSRAEQICNDGTCWNNFAPAPPGQTPACAKNGLTYCQHVYGYPAEVIQKLAAESNSRKFLSSESMVEFKAKIQAPPPPVVRSPYPPAFFTNQVRHSPTYPKYVPSNNYNYRPVNQPNGLVDPIYIPKPSVENGWTFYNAPQVYQNRPVRNNFYYPGPQPVKSYSPSEWLRRYSRNLRLDDSNNSTSTAFSYSSFLAPHYRRRRQATDSLVDLPVNEEFHKENLKNMFLEQIGSRSRTKRQNFNKEDMCKSTSSFVNPQAALSVNGDWKYIVNSNPDIQQLVKAVRCDGTSCSGLCSLPNGYRSQCEQRYVQKRLVALQADGTSLYTDTFWFPSCCICTISLQ